MKFRFSAGIWNVLNRISTVQVSDTTMLNSSNVADFIIKKTLSIIIPHFKSPESPADGISRGGAKILFHKDTDRNLFYNATLKRNVSSCA